MFPAEGKFTPWQREYYGIYLLLYQALMISIKVHSKPAEVIADAVVKMDAVMAEFHFTDDKIKAAAAQFVERYGEGQGPQPWSQRRA